MPHMDYNGFDKSYFEGEAEDVAGGGHPAGYSRYGRSRHPAQHYTAALLKSLAEHGIRLTNPTIGVIGCAYGFTVAQLDALPDITAYGLDISGFAVSQADPALTITEGDACSRADLKNARVDGRPDVLLNECILSCLSDSEAERATANLRKEAKKAVIHRVWSTDGSDLNPDYYHARTLAEWRDFLDPDGEDLWYRNTFFEPNIGPVDVDVDGDGDASA